MVSGGDVKLNNVSGRERLRPNGPGSETAIVYQEPDSGAHWEKVDECSPDDDSSFVYQRYSSESGIWRRDLYSMQDHSVGTGTINSVNFNIRVKRYVQSARDGWAMVAFRTNGTTYNGNVYQITPYDTWTNYSETFTTNPSTGVAWTWSEIDNLEIGVSLKMEYSFFLGSATGCTQVYAEVDYGSSVTSGDVTSIAVSPTIGGATWDTFAASQTLPSGTDITYNILNAGDDSIICGPISAASAASGYDISGCAGGSTIKLYAELSSDGSSTPLLHDWSVICSAPSTPTPTPTITPTVTPTVTPTITPTTTPTATPTQEGNGTGCFIATASSIDPDNDGSVLALRGFRDEYLIKSSVGSGIVSTYYTMSPPIAQYIYDNPSLKPAVRLGLIPVTAVSSAAISLTLLQKSLLIAGLLLLLSIPVILFYIRRSYRQRI